MYRTAQDDFLWPNPLVTLGNILLWNPVLLKPDYSGAAAVTFHFICVDLKCEFNVPLNCVSWDVSVYLTLKIWLKKIQNPDEVAEWFWWWTANPLCSVCVGWNPILVVFLFGCSASFLVIAWKVMKFLLSWEENTAEVPSSKLRLQRLSTTAFSPSTRDDSIPALYVWVISKLLLLLLNSWRVGRPWWKFHRSVKQRSVRIAHQVFAPAWVCGEMCRIRTAEINLQWIQPAALKLDVTSVFGNLGPETYLNSESSMMASMNISRCWNPLLLLLLIPNRKTFIHAHIWSCSWVINIRGK